MVRETKQGKGYTLLAPPLILMHNLVHIYDIYIMYMEWLSASSVALQILSEKSGYSLSRSRKGTI